VTAQEMHIAVNLGVQKLASFQADNLLPEEIDYELNIAMRRFISQRYNPQGNKYQRGFEQSQKRLDDLRHLVEDAVVTTGSYMGIGYTSTTNGNIHIYRFKFPTDYMFLINVLTDCVATCRKRPIYFEESYIYKDYLRINVSPPVPGFAIKQISIANVAGAAESIILGISGLSYDYLLGDYYTNGIKPSLSSNDSLTDRYFETVSADSPPADGNEIYLEKEYSQDNREGGFYTFGEQEGQEGITGAYAQVTWVNTSNDANVFDQVINTPPLTSYITTRKFPPLDADNLPEGIVLTDLPDFSNFRTNCKFVQQDDIYKVLDDPFNTTKSSRILYTIQETFLDIYTTETFIPNVAQIKYLRRPAGISAGGGVGCELPEHTHHEIVEMAVKSILEGVESPRYQTQSGEVLESE